MNAAERDLISSSLGTMPQSAAGRGIPWRSILSSPQMWLICAMYFCYAYSSHMPRIWRRLSSIR